MWTMISTNQFIPGPEMTNQSLTRLRRREW